MRILYLCPDLGIPIEGHKGASAHVRDLVKAFKNLGHEVEVIASSNGNNNGFNAKIIPIKVSNLYESLSSDNTSHILRALRHIWNNVTVEKLLDEVLSDFNPDIIYERYSPFGVSGVVMANNNGIPHVLEVNAPLVWEGKQFRKQALVNVAEELEQIVLKKTSLIITVSNTLHDILINYGVPDSRIAVIPNGVDVTNFTFDDTVCSNNSRDKFVIGFVGSMKSWHGIDILADAFRELSFDPSYNLLVVGDGLMLKVMRGLRDEFPGRVTLTGAVPHNEVPSYIRSMDIAVAPYPNFDNFYFSPLKILEYMAVGKAVVAAEIGQIKELIDHGRTGFLVPPGDSISLADAIKHLHANRELCHSVGLQAADEVKSKHTWSHRASDIINIINNLNAPVEIGELTHD
jgi:glycosyltransferase involved in cell wall biosynthesis